MPARSLIGPFSNRLAGRIGNGLANQPQDVLWAKLALACLGRYPTRDMAHGYIDRALDEAIRHHPWDRGLRRDGVMAQGGETERSSRTDLALLAGKAIR